MADLIVRDDQTLAFYAADLEAACIEIDSHDGEIPPDLMKRFECASLALSAKVDRWIGYLDGVKGMILMLDIRSKRAAAALKAARTLQEGLKGYIKFVMLSTPNVPYKGNAGTLYLHGQAAQPKYSFVFPDKSVANVVDDAFIKMEPSIVPYLVPVTHQVLNTEKIKTDLAAGAKLNWATLEKGSHVRAKG